MTDTIIEPRSRPYLSQADPEATGRSCWEGRNPGDEERQSEAAKEDHVASAEIQLPSQVHSMAGLILATYDNSWATPR